MYKGKYLILIFLLFVNLFACSKSDDSSLSENAGTLGFQSNVDRNADSEFEIVSVMKDGGALEEIYDGIDGKGMSEKLENLVNNNLEEFIAFSRTASDLLTENSELISKLLDSDVKNILEWLTGSNPEKQAKFFNYSIAASYSYNINASREKNK